MNRAGHGEREGHLYPGHQVRQVRLISEAAFRTQVSVIIPNQGERQKGVYFLHISLRYLLNETFTKTL